MCGKVGLVRPQCQHKAKADEEPSILHRHTSLADRAIALGNRLQVQESAVRRFSAALYPKVQFLERPDWWDPAVDFVGFRKDVSGGLLKQSLPACGCRAGHRAGG